jgi:hypothetical protein
MDTGFALDQFLRGQRAENARQAQALVAQPQQIEQQHQNRLAEMLYGENLKQQSAQTEAERSAPFLEQLIKGNPDVAKAFGYGGGQPATPGDFEGGATPAVAPVTPTREQVTGIARAVPGITQALVNRSLTPNAPFTLGPGQQRFDAQGNPIASGPPMPGMSQQQAEAVRDDMVARNPQLRGRVTVQSDAKGMWTVRETPSEPLTESPNLWLSNYLDPNKPVPERIQAKMKYDEWMKGQQQLAQQRENVKPLDAQRAQILEKQNEGIQAAYQLLRFTPGERETFTGAGRMGYEAAAHAAELGLPTQKFGYSPEQIQRYQDFKKWNGYIEQFKFALGGKQLTNAEQRVVESFIPTGKERTTSEYEAKLRSVAAAMEAAQEVDMYMAQTGKGFVDPTTMRSMYVEALKRKGIDVTAKSKDALRDQMRSGDRLRQDFSK